MIGSGFGGGFLAGFATGLATRELVMLSVAIAKPVAKSLIKASIATYERGKESLASMKESFDDMVAEVREGTEEKQAATATSGAEGTKAAKGSNK